MSDLARATSFILFLLAQVVDIFFEIQTVWDLIFGIVTHTWDYICS